MRKENLYASNGKEVLPASFDCFPENLKQKAASLMERGKKISFKPLEYQEALSLVPDLKEISYAYKENLEKFAPLIQKLKKEEPENRLIPDVKKKNPDDFFHREIRDFLTHKMGCLVTAYGPEALDENQKNIINNGKHEIGDSFEKNGAAWNAIYSFFFSCLHDFRPQEEIFKIQPDPFAPLLNFADKGVIVRTDYPKFLIDIPVISHNKKIEDGYFFACWDPFAEKSITHGHLSDQQNCDCRKSLVKGQLIVNNENHERPLVRPTGWG